MACDGQRKIGIRGRRLPDRNHRLKYGPMFGIIKKTWGFIPKAFRESGRILAFVIWAVQGSKHVIFAVKAGKGASVTKYGGNEWSGNTTGYAMAAGTGAEQY